MAAPEEESALATFYWRQRISRWWGLLLTVAIIVAVAAVVLVSSSELVSVRTQLSKARDDLDATNRELDKAEKTLTDKQREISELNQTLSDKQREISELNLTSERLRASITSLKTVSTQLAQYAPKDFDAAKTIQAADNARYVLNVWGFKVDPDRFNKVVEYVKNEGFTVTQAAELETRPSWLSERSMVTYYSPESLTTAQSLAVQLTKITGMPFAVGVGGGVGVPKGSERWNLRVHFVGN
jgi:hypothetical protein